MAAEDLIPEEPRAEDAKETPTGGYLYPDAQALQLALDDLERCDTYINQQLWANNWVLCDTLLQSPQNTNMLMGSTRSNIPVFTLSNTISAITPKLMEAIFYEDPPFMLRPRPGTSQDIVRAKTAVLSYQLDEMKFQEQCELLLEQDQLMGTCIAKWGWTEKIVKHKVYKQKIKPEVITTETGYKSTIHTAASDEITFDYEEEKVYTPWLKYVDMRTVRVDPGCRVGDITKAKYVVHTEYPTWSELNDLRDMSDYDIPSEAVLKEFFAREEGVKQQGDNLAMTMPEGMRGWLQHAVPRNQKTTADPLETPLMLIERQDCHSHHHRAHSRRGLHPHSQ